MLVQPGETGEMDRGSRRIVGVGIATKGPGFFQVSPPWRYKVDIIRKILVGVTECLFNGSTPNGSLMRSVVLATC
jgi:hypothetical protein